MSENTFENIDNFLLTHFEYGIRVNSPIELMRLKRFYAEDYGVDCPWSDKEITQKILSSCFVHEGKGYVIDSDSIAAVLEQIIELRNSGACIVYYKELYEKNEERFYKFGIFSDEMLKSFVKKYFPTLFCRKLYFSWEKATEKELLKRNIVTVWAEEILQDYDDLSKKMKYIPLEKIKYALANNSCFVWNSVETYTIESAFTITKDEERIILSFVDENVEKKGYVFFEDIPAQSVFSENYKLSDTAIYTLIYDKVLSRKYERCNKVVLKKGEEKDVVKLIKDYCLSKKEITLEELFEQWELRTGTHRQAEPLDIAYSTMIRINADKFVCDEFVVFNSQEIDKALDTIVTDDAVSLKEISSFVLFPECHYSWNLFLLESFCRRFSKAFKYMAVTTNSRNAGAIVRKECNYDYHTMLAHVLAKRKIALEENVIMDYLYENGFIARRSYKYLKELINLVTELYEGR